MRLLISTLLLALASACATVPITGREQLHMVSDARLIAESDRLFTSLVDAAERHNAVIRGSESPETKTAYDMVQRVGHRIVDAAGLGGQRRWEVLLVRARVANAFALPSGKIVVFTGILPLTQNESALAAVLGHEVSHVVARHSAERLSQVLLGNAVQGTVGVAMSRSSNGPMIGAALGMGLQYGVILPYSRLHESEADHMGLLLAAKAGYDPSEAAGLWQRMAAKGGSGRLEFTSTHPSDATRIAQIREWLPEAMVYYADRNRPLPTNLAELGTMRAARADAAALAPLGEKPVWQDGSSYRMRRSDRPSDTEIRLERRSTCPVGDLCWASISNGEDETLYTDDLSVIEVRTAATTTRFDPPLITMRWPLRVGDSWTQSVSMDNGTASRTLRVKADVVAYESITVPAGSFDAFKIVITINGAPFRDSWFAPALGALVRSVASDGKGGFVTREVTDYPNELGVASVTWQDVGETDGDAGDLRAAKP